MLAHGMFRLRWAYLYRESSGEGLGFLWTGIELVVAGLVVLLGVMLLALGAWQGSGPRRRVFMLLAVASAEVLTVCTLSAIAVSGASGCIGPCG